MDANELRQLQTPLKERYRVEPGAARIVLHARGSLGEGVTCDVETSVGTVRAGLHPATGGTGREACSGDMLLQALAACAGVTLRAVATSMGIAIRSGTVHAEGDLDFRGTLGVSKEAPVGFETIRVRFELDSDAPREQLDRLVGLTERYCVVAQTILTATPVTLSIGPRD